MNDGGCQPLAQQLVNADVLGAVGRLLGDGESCGIALGMVVRCPTESLIALAAHVRP